MRRAGPILCIYSGENDVGRLMYNVPNVLFLSQST